MLEKSEKPARASRIYHVLESVPRHPRTDPKRGCVEDQPQQLRNKRPLKNT
jgi:hypothetical protein